MAVRRLLGRFPANARAAVLREAVAPKGRPTATDRDPSLVAVQSVEDPLYFALFSAIADALARRRSIRGELVVVRAVSGAIGVGARAWIMRSAWMTWILSSQWVRLYRDPIAQVAYRTMSWSHPVSDLIDWFASARVWRQHCSTSGDFSLVVRGVPVGDLVVDSFLRFRPSPRFQVADPLVRRLIWQA